jgi:hypothetical protein
MPAHVCIDCKALPEDEQPKTPRPTEGGPRSQRCATHYRAYRRAEKTRRAEYWQRTVYGLDPANYAALKAFQGDRCPCGNKIAQTDHDSALAAQHDHPDNRACEDCLRGLLCRFCNSDLLGKHRFTAARLRAVADYLERPPWHRLRRTRTDLEDAS